MTEYVTPNIHTVLKKYQTSAPKSLQGPGHALTAAGCSTSSNCPLDATLTCVGGSGGNNVDLSIANARNLCAGHVTTGILPPNGLATGNSKLSPHCQLIAPSSSPACSNSPNTSSALPTPAVALIKKEVLSSPEPLELGDTLPPQTLPLPLSMSSQTTQSQTQTTHPQQPPLTTVKIIPPPPPELSQPIFTAPDSGSGVLYETRLEGKTIGCFSLGGEMRLCLPQFLNNVLADFTLDQINRIFDELGIYCSQCTPDQLLEFKTAKILPPDVKASGLITRTDAERLCAALLNRMDRNNYINDDDIPKGAISFKVYHRCFGKCDGICTPDLYSYNKPTCIMCLECKGWFSPQKFVGHVHRAVENRTCHWGFDSRNWHDYLHVALDVENREKYQKILDELKEVEIKEALKAQNELIYMKRKAALHMDDEMIASQLGHPLSGIVGPPHHQSLGLSDKQRTGVLDIPTKKAKGLDEAAAYQLEYQRYQSLMYAHCAQQQRVGSMSAFRPWAPKSFLHPAATYNAVAAFSTLPYLSQEPPVLQNPERVVRSTDRERFERTYQPNVALVPRKCILAKEREKDQREFRERERERERERIEREREVERIREQERKLERSREREQTREREELERERREREMQQQRQHHLLQQQNLHHQQQTQQALQDQVALAGMCGSEVQIKQERANTPNDMPQSPPLTNTSGGGDDDHLERRSNEPMDEDTTLPMISPMSLTMSQQQRKLLSNNQSGSNSNSSSNHSDIDTVQQQQQQQLQDHHQQQQQQQRRHSLYTSNSSACSTSSTTSTTPPQQQRLPAHLPPPQQYQQQPQQHQTQQAQQQRHMQHLTLQQQQQQARLRQSPRTFPPSPSDTHSSEEFSGSNEITSSTSPAPCNETNRRDHASDHNNHHSQTTINRERQQQSQTLIATVNQHTKLLPTPISATFTASNNSNNNNNELPSRIRISKNLINRANIIRSPTPPSTLPPVSAIVQISPQQQTQQQTQMQVLQNHQQQYEYYKQNQRVYDPQQQQYQPLSSIQHQHLVIRSQHHPSQQTQHSPSSSQSSTVATTGLNLSTHPTKASIHSHPAEVQNQQQRSHNGLPHIGSEFELSTDTDDDSVNGEADSSNLLAPWDIAVDALRDTKPKERERVLNMLRKLLHENQQMRYSNLQLSEMIHKRDIEIRELRDQLQTCRRHMQMLSLQNETPVQTSRLHQGTNYLDEEMQEFVLKKSVSSSNSRDMQKDYSETKETATIDNGDNAERLQSPTGVVVKQNERHFSDSEDEEDDPNRCDDNDASGAESENDEEAGNAVAMQESNSAPTSDRNDIKDRDSSTQQPQAKRSRIDDSDGESAGSSSRKSTAIKMDQTTHSTRAPLVNSSFDSDDDTPSCNTERTAMTNMGSECSNTKNNSYNNELADDDEEREEEEEATRFTVTNGSSTDTNTSEDDDAEGCVDGSRDENSCLLPCTQAEENDVQAPHSNALATPPTATSPLSPHSAATAGQLFDSSNSSDETSMKKAQMSASNALAKISDTIDKVYEKIVKGDEVMESCDEDQDSTDSGQRKFDTQKDEHHAPRGPRYVDNSNLLLGKSLEAYNATRDGHEDDKYGNIGSKTTNANVKQITRTPLATKASKKQTPATNTELMIKKEIT